MARKVRRIIEESRSDSFQQIWGSGQPWNPDGAVTTSKALQVSTVWACVRILSENVATLPLDMFLRTNGVKKPYRPRPEWLNFNTGPWNKIDFLVQAMTSLLLDGNAYIATQRDDNMAIRWVTLLDPDKVTPKMDAQGRITFRVMVDGREQVFTDRQIQHVRGMMLPGTIEGVSPIHYARQTINLSLSTTDYGASFFKNDARPSMIIEVPGTLSPVGVSQLKSAWNDVHQGPKNANKIGVVTEGAALKAIGVNPEDAQFLETRKFQVPDVARIFGVPVHLLAHEGATQLGSSISEQNVAFVQHSLRPWVERIEAALSDAERLSALSDPDAFVGLNVNGLMRGDYASRITTNVMAVREGVFTINEMRQMEDLPPVEWGDEPISIQVQEQAPEPAPLEGEPA